MHVSCCTFVVLLDLPNLTARVSRPEINKNSQKGSFWGLQKSPLKYPFSDLFSGVFVKDQYVTHGLTWLKSKGSVTQGPALSDLRSLSHCHCIISPNCERPSFDLAVSFFHSLSGILGSPLLSLSSLRFISIFGSF